MKIYFANFLILHRRMQKKASTSLLTNNKLSKSRKQSKMSNSKKLSLLLKNLIDNLTRLPNLSNQEIIISLEETASFLRLPIMELALVLDKEVKLWNQEIIIYLEVVGVNSFHKMQDQRIQGTVVLLIQMIEMLLVLRKKW